jgi:3-oxoacyl-[acyl-carrier protein] reductase
VKAVTAAGGKAVAVAGDVSSRDGVRALYDAAEQNFGGIDIVVNNAGVFTAAPIEYISEEDFDRLVAINLKSVFFAGQEAAQRIRGGGRIINVSAGLPAGGIAFMGAYGATKAGVEVLTRSLAHQLGSRGVTVNAVAPGPTETDMLAPEARQQLEGMKAMMPLGRLGQPADIADVVVFLATAEARWITAQTIGVNGGFE